MLQPKEVIWISSSRKDLESFPLPVRKKMGFGLWQAQIGKKPAGAKVLKGFSGAGAVEIIRNHQSGTYRVIYTIQFAKAIYVLHAFQKKSKKRVKTPVEEIELVRNRLKVAEEHYEEWGKQKKDDKD
jgi:phage-related protein